MMGDTMRIKEFGAAMAASLLIMSLSGPVAADEPSVAAPVAPVEPADVEAQMDKVERELAAAEREMERDM